MSIRLDAQTANITPLGPTGGIVSLICGTDNDSIVLAVTRGSELYRSVDGGENWEQIILPIQNPPVGGPSSYYFSIYDIAFHPSADTALMATSVGLFRSTDAGFTWNLISTYPYPRYCVKYVPSAPSLIFGSDDTGVMESTDGGDTWQMKTDNLLYYRPIRRLAINPADGDTRILRILATTDFYDTTGVFYTPDGGTTWVPWAMGLPYGDARRIFSIDIDTIGFMKGNFRAVIGTADGIYDIRTDQTEINWLPLKNNGVRISGVVANSATVLNSYDSTGPVFSCFAASNGSEYDGKPNEYSVNYGLLKIDSRYGSLDEVNPLDLPQVSRVFNKLSDINSIFIPYKKSDQKIYLGTSIGIFVSVDGGGTWVSKNNNIFQTSIRNLVSVYIPSLSKSVLFAAIYGGGIFRSDDDGVSWKPANTGITNPYTTTIIYDNKKNILYAGTTYTMYYSNDWGASWNSLDQSKFPVIVDSTRYLTSDNEMTIRVSPKNPDIVMFFSRSSGLYVTTDGGATWNYRQSPVGIDSIHVPENVEFDPVDSLVIYFSGVGLYKSYNLGKTWSNFTSNLPLSIYQVNFEVPVGIQTLSLTVNLKNNQEMFLPSVFDVDNGSPFRLWKTINGGASWDTTSYPLPVYDVQYDRYDIHRILASGPGGIFASTNSGSIWTSLTDPKLIPARYLLLSTHHSDPTIFYLGSENGAYKIEMNDKSKLTVDTLLYDFGSVKVGLDSIRIVRLMNSNGARNVVVRFAGLSDTSSFKYFGKDEYDIPAGGKDSFTIKFIAASGGIKSGILRFFTSDQIFDTIRFALIGRASTSNTIEKFSYDFGSVPVGEDSIITIKVDNQYGSFPIAATFIGLSDTVSFEYMGSKLLTINTGDSAFLQIRFAPKNTGSKVSYIKFTTNILDPRYSSIVLRLQGMGVTKSYISRRVLLDTAASFLAYDGSSLAQYYKLFIASLVRAGIKVDLAKELPASEYNAMVYVLPDGPPPQDIIDTLVHYVLNGGTLVTIGDFGGRNNLPFNTFLHDSVWEKYNIQTGISFDSNLVIDVSYTDTSNAGISIAYPAVRNAMTYNVDSVVLFTSGSVKIDSTVKNAFPLLIAKAPSLVSINIENYSIDSVREKPVAAYSNVGKGKIIAIADYDIWWNGIQEDTTKPFGIFGGNNLRFALNIFGLVDNLVAQLPERTPKEEFKLFSIPYSFEDSSVIALFKDLGKPNIYVWRMFGNWRDSIGYEEFPYDFKNIRRGAGYWLITREAKDINFGTTTVQGSESDFEIELRPGYNMIGNPFPYRVSWLESIKEDSVEPVLWKWDKDFDTTSIYMEPFEGYFVKNRGRFPKKIKINSMPVTSTTMISKNQYDDYNYSSTEWKLQIIAQTPKAVDERNYVGMLKNSSNGYDGEDFSEPPTAPSDYVSLSSIFGKDRLAADYRAISTEGQYWDLEITSSSTKVPVSINLNKFGNLPSNFKIYLIDKTDERVADVTASLSYSYVLGKKDYIRQIRIIVGTKEYVENNTAGIPIVPIEYSLEQNYPNPFNPLTTIKYSLSHSAVVKLEIFNILGQKIKTIVNQFQPIGVYSILWDGTDDGGKKVASGFYYYRLQANEYTNVKKMTLIK